MEENKKIIEVNATTGEQTERDMTPEEVENWEAIKAESLSFHAAQEAAEEAKAEAKASALAKLAALGLTEEEAKAIAG